VIERHREIAKNSFQKIVTAEHARRLVERRSLALEALPRLKDISTPYT